MQADVESKQDGMGAVATVVSAAMDLLIFEKFGLRRA